MKLLLNYFLTLKHGCRYGYFHEVLKRQRPLWVSPFLHAFGSLETGTGGANSGDSTNQSYPGLAKYQERSYAENSDDRRPHKSIEHNQSSSLTIPLQPRAAAFGGGSAASGGLGGFHLPNHRCD